MRNGYGVFYFSDGRKFSGDWKDGKQHGKGCYEKKFIKREGVWKNGKKILCLNKLNKSKKLSKRAIDSFLDD